MRTELDSLVTDKLQIRVEMLEECIEGYAVTYRETPEKMPPVVVYYDAALDRHYLADGFHRVAAVKRNGGDTIPAEVREGTFDDALRTALKANATNGLRRSKADMIHAMEVALAEWDTLYKNEKRTTEDGLPSKRQLMEICNATDHAATIFLQKSRVVESTTPRKSAITGEVTNCFDGKACGTCGDTGFMTKHQYAMLPPEFKAESVTKRNVSPPASAPAPIPNPETLNPENSNPI